LWQADLDQRWVQGKGRRKKKKKSFAARLLFQSLLYPMTLMMMSYHLPTNQTKREERKVEKIDRASPDPFPFSQSTPSYYTSQDQAEMEEEIPDGGRKSRI
jgi:hypothetical protein